MGDEGKRELENNFSVLGRPFTKMERLEEENGGGGNGEGWNQQVNFRCHETSTWRGGLGS